MKYLILVLVLCFMVTGCATQANFEMAVSSWMGHSSDELVQAWGAPASEYKLANGKRILTYMFEGGNVGYANYNPYTRSMLMTSSPRSCKTTFTVDQFDRVTDWQYEGNMCRSFAAR